LARARVCTRIVVGLGAPRTCALGLLRQAAEALSVCNQPHDAGVRFRGPAQGTFRRPALRGRVDADARLSRPAGNDLPEPVARAGRTVNARADIFATIRRSLTVSGREAPRRAAVADRLAQAPKGIVPERAARDGAARIALFRRE